MSGYFVMWLMRVWNTRRTLPMSPEYSKIIGNLTLITLQVVVLYIGIGERIEGIVLLLILGVMVIWNRRDLWTVAGQVSAALKQSSI